MHFKQTLDPIYGNCLLLQIYKYILKSLLLLLGYMQ